MESTDDCPPHGIPRPYNAIEPAARKEVNVTVNLNTVCNAITAICAVLIVVKLY